MRCLSVCLVQGGNLNRIISYCILSGDINIQLTQWSTSSNECWPDSTIYHLNFDWYVAVSVALVEALVFWTNYLSSLLSCVKFILSQTCCKFCVFFLSGQVLLSWLSLFSTSTFEYTSLVL